MLTSHPEVVRKLHAWSAYFNRSLEKCFHRLRVEYLMRSWYQLHLQQGWCASVYSLCLDRAAFFHSWPVMETSSTSTTIVSTWCTSVASWPPPWPNLDASWGEPSLDRVEFLLPRRKWWGHHQLLVIFPCLSLFLSCPIMRYLVPHQLFPKSALL